MAKDFRETLYTVDERGRRKWVYSSLIKGRFFKFRSVVAYFLMAFYLLMPWVSISGKQGVLLDFTTRRFVFFGAEFWATDTQFLFLIFALLAFVLFFFTAVFGRVWCGWACPETVFLEFLFRPIERLIEGNAVQRKRLDESSWTFEKIWKKAVKHSLCAAFAWILASTALAYFVGREPLLEMMMDWPNKNPVPFTMTLVLMALMAFQFGWFREQFCTVLCPYARFQSVLMDSESIIVGYDVIRGEPRAKARKNKSQEKGDCVDCGLCVRVCPTGIDIRNGLQLECVACTSCMDACDSIMHKVGKEPGLIRYDTENRLLGKSQIKKLIRPRPIVYALLVGIFFTTLVYLLKTRSLSEFQILRGAQDMPYSILADSRISNHLHLRVSNKSEKEENYTFQLLDQPGIELITPLSPLSVPAKEIKTTPVFLNFSSSLLVSGKRKVIIQIKSKSYVDIQEVTLLGPDERS